MTPRSCASPSRRTNTSAVACASGSARWHGSTDTPKKNASEARLTRWTRPRSRFRASGTVSSDRRREPLARQPLELAVDEADVEARVVGHERRVARERREPPQRRRDPRRPPQLLVREPGQPPDRRGQRHARRDERLERLPHLEPSTRTAPISQIRADGRREPRRLEVEDDEARLLERGSRRSRRARRTSPRQTSRASCSTSGASSERASALGERPRGEQVPRGLAREHPPPRSSTSSTSRSSESNASCTARPYTNICSYHRRAAGVDPPRRPRLVLRLGRAARRPAPARPAGDRRRGRRARGELRGEGVRRAHGDGRGDWRGGCARTRSSCRRACRRTSRRARPCSRCSRTRRRSSRGSRSTRRSSTSAGSSTSAARRRDRARACAATCASRSACRSPSASRGRSSSRRWRAASRSRTGCSSSRPSASSRSSTRCRSSGSGASAPRRPRSSTLSGSPPSARSPRSPSALVVLLGRASGRKLHALAHNRDPRRVEGRRRRGSIGAQRALGAAAIARRGRRRAARPRRPRHPPHAHRAAHRPHRRAPAALRRLLARDPLAHAAVRDRAHADDPRHGRGLLAGAAADRAPRLTLVGIAVTQPRGRHPAPARAPFEVAGARRSTPRSTRSASASAWVR